MMLWYGGHWAFWQSGLMWIGMLVFLGLLIWGVYALITTATRKPGSQEDRDDPTSGAWRILDERLARGEIDPDEYRRLRDLLKADQAMSQAGSRGSS